MDALPLRNGIAEWGMERYVRSAPSLGNQDVYILIINDTDLELSRNGWDGGRDVDWRSAPSGTIKPRSSIDCVATWKSDLRLTRPEISLSYTVGGSPSICEIHLSNSLGLTNEARTVIQEPWHDQGYRLFRRDDRNSYTLVIRKLGFPRQGTSVRADGVKMTDSPSAAVGGNTIFCFYQGENKALWLKELRDPSGGRDLREWRAGDSQIPGVTLGWSPSAVEWRSRMFVFHHGVSDGAIWYHIFGDGQQLNQKVPGAALMNSPATAVYDEKIHVVHKGAGENEPLYHIVYNGKEWFQDTQIPGNNPSESPSLAVFRDKLFCFYQSANRSGDLYWTEFDGKGWSKSQQVPATQLSFSPSVVVARDRMYVFHQGRGTSRLWCNIFDGKSWSGDQDFLGVEVVNGPTACVQNDTIYVFHQGGGRTGELWCMPLPL